MIPKAAIVVLGTFDSKPDELFFLEQRIKQRGFPVLTIHVGTGGPCPLPVDLDLYGEAFQPKEAGSQDRDEVISKMIARAKAKVRQLYRNGKISGVISAGGGTGTHLGTSIMRVLPLGVPKVMISTVASRDMSVIVGTKDITMIHSVADMLGVNSITGKVLDSAAGAICGMVQSKWAPEGQRKRIALSMFGFVTKGAEKIKSALEERGYEVVAFHANGTGGMAMEELALEGYFDGILDFATHELADELKGGYCAGIGPGRLLPPAGTQIPRLVVPGGLDCAVLEFTRDSVPKEYRDRRIFFYDFRSAVRLSREETLCLADQLTDKINRDPRHVRVLIPARGWSEADRQGAPLYDPELNALFVERLRKDLDRRVVIEEVDFHINDSGFATLAADTMDRMIKANQESTPPPT